MSPKRTTVAVFGACATGVALSLVDLLLRHSDALAMRRIGGTMLPSMPGDEAHRERLREQLASLTPAPRLQDAGDCASLRRLQEFQRRAGEIGEVGALRERAGAFDAP